MPMDITGTFRAGRDRQDEYKPYQVETIKNGDNSIQYIRYFDKGIAPCGITKIETTISVGVETITCTFAYAPWDARASVDTKYIPINDSWNM